MKTIIIVVVIAAAGIWFAAPAQLAPPAAKSRPAPALAAPEPVAPRGLPPVATGRPGGAANEPMEGSSDAPPRGIGAGAPRPVPAPWAQNVFGGGGSDGSGPLTQYRYGEGSAGGGLGPVPAPPRASGRFMASGPAQSASEMLRESELKVLRKHYENVLQRALEAEEKYQLATTDGAGNTKAQPDADANLYRDRAAVLRRYAERLEADIAKASQPGGGSPVHTSRGMPGMSSAPMVAVPAPPPLAGAPGTTPSYEILREYPVTGAGGFPGAMPPAADRGSSSLRGYRVGGDPRDVSGRIELLTAQIRAQKAALDSEVVSLEEAEENLQRADAAFAQKTISAEEMSGKRYAVKKIKIRLEQLKAELEATQAELGMAKAQYERLNTPSTTPPPPATPGAPSALPPTPAPGGLPDIPGLPSATPSAPGTGGPAIEPPGSAPEVPANTGDQTPARFLLKIMPAKSGLPTYRFNGTDLDRPALNQRLVELGNGHEKVHLVVSAAAETPATLVTDILKYATRAGVGHISLEPAREPARTEPDAATTEEAGLPPAPLPPTPVLPPPIGR